MAAASRVFAVFELLEAILLNLPLYSVVQGTTVCHAFQDTISSSKRLRDRLDKQPVPLFALLCPSKPETEDVCNVDNTSPWFFRTTVEHGVVLVLRTNNTDVQLYVPNDRKEKVCRLDSRRTTGNYEETAYKVVGWARWYDDQERLICRKELAASRFVIQKPDSLWSYLTNDGPGNSSAKETTVSSMEKIKRSRTSACYDNSNTGCAARAEPQPRYESSGQKKFDECNGWLTD